MKQKKTIEDYLKTIFVLAENNNGVRGSSIAEHLNVSRPTVSVALKELIHEGYLEMDEWHEVHLTAKGMTIAKATYDRHQILQNLLEELGVDSVTAAQDACEMEHVVSAASYNALKSLVKGKREITDE